MQPKTSTAGPSRPNQEVEGDFIFWEGNPIYHLLDRFQRFHLGKLQPDKTLGSILDSPETVVEKDC